MRLVSWLLSLLPKPKTPEEIRDQLRDPILEALRARIKNVMTHDHWSDCPYGLAISVRASVNDVETACVLLEKDGLIRRSDHQVVEPDENGKITGVYVRYELSGPSA